MKSEKRKTQLLCWSFSQVLRLLMCRRICAPPEWNIRICDPITSYFVLLCSLMLAWHTRFSLLIFHLYLRFCVSFSLKQALFLSGSKILIFYSGRLQISRHISLVGYYQLLCIGNSHRTFGFFTLRSSLFI